MKKIININLSGRVIPIEDSAYEKLQGYIDSLRRYFAKEEGRDEIINDIESRIAELMNEKVRKGADAINDSDINEIITSMGRVEDFDDVTAGENYASGTQAQAAPPRRGRGRLYRDGSDKLLGGVCSGIANYMNVDPAIIRLIFAIITFGGFGMGILIYILLWIILPVRHLETYIGKRLFRNPDDKVISGVAGGLAAYFDKPSWVIRLIFVAPLLLNVLFGTLNGIFFDWERNIFPNLFVGSFTGTFLLAYIILWIVLPEAKSSFERMEMRGEKVDVNTIRQNVKEGMSEFKGKMETFGSEVKESAQQFGEKARDFASTRGKAFASEVADTARPVGRGFLHVIGVLFKAFFIFIVSIIVLSLFAVFLSIIFGGVAWWPVNDFLWSSYMQRLSFFGTLIFFIGIPAIALMTWLIRRIANIRSRRSYLGWIFGGLWVIGWISAVMFASSIARDLREYERVSSDVAINQPAGGKLIVNVNEPEIRYSRGFWWMDMDANGWDITEDTMKYNNVKLRILKSLDSSYHLVTYKYSMGKNVTDAQERASKTVFNVSSQDSMLNIGSGLSIDKETKFRGQGVILEIHVPVGKKIRFDESVMHAYDPWVVRRSDREYERGWGRRYRYRVDWDYDEYFDWDANVDYVMQADGKLIDPLKPAKDSSNFRYENRQQTDQERENRKKQLQEELERIQQEERRDTIERRTGAIKKEEEVETQGLSLPVLSVGSIFI